MKIIKRRKGRPITHNQWIEITHQNGVTVSTFYPPNHEFDRLLRDMRPQPDLIYRRLNFIHGVPSEYAWLEPDPLARIYGGCFIQRILPKEWPILMARESIMPRHHVIPSCNAQPRPEIYGPCPCPLCAEERRAGKPSRYPDPPLSLEDIARREKQEKKTP